MRVGAALSSKSEVSKKANSAICEVNSSAKKGGGKNGCYKIKDIKKTFEKRKSTPPENIRDPRRSRLKSLPPDKPGNEEKLLAENEPPRSLLIELPDIRDTAYADDLGTSQNTCSKKRRLSSRGSAPSAPLRPPRLASGKICSSRVVELVAMRLLCEGERENLLMFLTKHIT